MLQELYHVSLQHGKRAPVNLGFINSLICVSFLVYLIERKILLQFIHNKL